MRAEQSAPPAELERCHNAPNRKRFDETVGPNTGRSGDVCLGTAGIRANDRRRQRHGDRIDGTRLAGRHGHAAKCGRRSRSHVQTQTDGSYVFTNLSVPGTYEVQADLQGFATVVHAGVTIAEGQRLTVDFTLYAATAEALVVTGRVATLEHQRSTIQQTGARCAGSRAAAQRPKLSRADVADGRIHRQCDRAESSRADLLEQQRHRRRREPFLQVARRGADVLLRLRPRQHSRGAGPHEPVLRRVRRGARNRHARGHQFRDEHASQFGVPLRTSRCLERSAGVHPCGGRRFRRSDLAEPPAAR